MPTFSSVALISVSRENSTAVVSLVSDRSSLADCEAKTGSTVSVNNSGISLDEAFKNTVLCIGRNADPGVADLKSQPNALSLLLNGVDRNDDKALLRKLDCVCGEGDENLLDVAVICQNMSWRTGRDVHPQCQRLRHSLCCEHGL